MISSQNYTVYQIIVVEKITLEDQHVILISKVSVP